MTVLAAGPGLPGLALPDRPAARRPSRLLAPGVLLLAGAQPGDHRVSFAEHTLQWGELPPATADELIAAASAGDLRGAGGALFPTARKIAALRDGASIVVVNGAEGEPTSGKDAVLLSHVPHLVLDGAEAVAHALGARRIVIRLAVDQPDLAAALERSIAERPPTVTRSVSIGPARFVAGEATAVLSALAGGPSLPRRLGRPPKLPRRFRRSQPVFLSNVETFARLAVLARGHRQSSSLVTASGAVSAPGVLELPSDHTLGDLATLVGLVGHPEILITGGWHGAWTHWPDAADAPLTPEGLAAVSGRWGVGSFTWVPDDTSGWAVLQAMAHQLAAESAGQCGPCHSGLPAIAGALSAGQVPPSELLAAVSGGGICGHPTAAVSAIRSALAVLAVLADQR